MAVCLYVCVSMYTSMLVCACMFVCVYVCLCIHPCMYISIQFVQLYMCVISILNHISVILIWSINKGTSGILSNGKAISQS